MSQPRLDLSAWKSRVIALASPAILANPIFQNVTNNNGVLQVFAIGERDIKQTFGRIYPAVYILRQSAISTNAGGASRGFRQTYNNYVEMSCVVEKYPDGVLTGEPARQALCDAVYDALFGWQPPDATLKLDLSSYEDGDVADVVNYGVHKWHTQTLFQGTP